MTMDTVQLLLLCSGSLLVGGLLIYLLFLRRKPDTHVTDQEEKKQPQSDQREVSSTSASNIAGSKKQAKSKKRREAQQEFTHSWMVGALKGHSGPVLDMDFSANGKFLASCADEAAGKSSTTSSQAKKDQQAPPSPSGSSKSSSSSSSSSLDQDTPQRAILSRRQRKNRTRAPRSREHDDDRPPPPPPPTTTTTAAKEHKKASRHHHHPDNKSAKQPGKELKSGGSKAGSAATTLTMSSGNKSHHPHEIGKPDGGLSKKTKRGFAKPQSLAYLPDASLSMMLRRYLLSCEEMSELGYPLEFSQFPGYVAIFHQPPHSQRGAHQHHHHHHHHRLNSQNERKPGAYNLDANAREFVPCVGPPALSWANIVSGCAGGAEHDSGRGSSTGSSLEGSDLEQDSSSSDSDKSSDIGDSPPPAYVPESAIERRCTRCAKAFYVGRDDGEYVHEDKCCYHWGKLRSGGWECCRGRESARGCTGARAHVWTGIVPGYNGPFRDFARTEPARHVPLDGNYGVYAIDCEMCFTKRGLEVGRVTLVDLSGEVVYETMVKPDAEVIDYNTRFSGLRARDFVRAKSLREVQQELKRFVFAETILIGHGLENDLRALRLLHPTIIDTTVWYPHYKGLPYRNSLKSLAWTYLRKEIQRHEHDSAEDARIALDLIYSKLDEHYARAQQQFSHYAAA